MSDPLITTERASEVCGLTVSTLITFRCRGKGPPFCRLGRAIRYRLSEVEAFRDRGRVETADSCDLREWRRRHEMPTDEAPSPPSPRDVYRELEKWLEPESRRPKVVQYEKFITYFLLDKATNAIKIGRTTKLRQRISNLDNGPVERVLLATFRGDHEGTFHEMFGAHRLRANREWFANCEAIEVFLADPPGKYRSMKIAP